MLFVKQPKRFSLLLLEEGEYYFDDYGGYYYPPGDDEQSFKKRVRGRIKLCSHSLMFEPEDIKLPIMKLPYKKVSFVDEWQGNLKSFMDTKAEIFVVRTSLTVEMKENNIVAPYVFKEERKEHRFSLNYVSLSSFLPQLVSLYALSKLPNEIAEVELRQIIQDKEKTMTFNISHLEDINEKIMLETTGVHIMPLIMNPGKILITNNIVYFQPMNNVTSNPVDKYKLDSITRIAKRRHLLRHVGLEIFMQNDQSIFFSFRTQQIRDSVYDTLMKHPPIQQSLVTDDQANMTLKWQNGIITNYEYLMYLNSMAGRSFNDITQYPVFPWIVSDYASRSLNLEDSKTFRDLSKPIGALNPDRLKMFKERMEETPDGINSLIYNFVGQPKFLYGTHYSTPGYVLFYLVREAPEYMLRLQNGRFDAPSRMFHSIAEVWWGVLNNAADVKELIPEFYNLSKRGSFLINSERLNLGTKETGIRIDDVVLPNWASDAEDFVKKLNEALESEYVSDHLHEWIDLIFGYKQQGSEALKASNVFYHLTYEGAVDIDKITDPHERAAIIAQIREFGQTPRQLFSSPHPFKLPKHARSATLNLTVASIPIETLDVGMLMAPLYPNWGRLNNLELDFSFKLHKDVITAGILSNDGNTLHTVSQDTSLKIYSLSEKKQLRSSNICGLTLSSVQLLPDEKTVLVGSWDNNIYTYNIDYGTVTDTLNAHDDAVSGICLRKDILASSSWDATVKIWKYSSNGIGKHPIVDILDFDTEVHSIDVDAGAATVVAGSADGIIDLVTIEIIIKGTITLIDIQSKSIIRRFHPHTDSISCVKFTPDGNRIITCSLDGTFKVIELGGSEVFSADLKEKLRCFATDGTILLIGGDNGLFRIWDIKSGTQLKQMKEFPEVVSSIVVSKKGEKVITGGAGTIRLYTTNKNSL